MVVTLPEGILTMKTKRTILKVNTKKYKKSSKKEKTKILDDLSYITKYNRAYISRLLRTHNSKIKIKDTLYKYKCGEYTKSCVKGENMYNEKKSKPITKKTGNQRFPADNWRPIC